MSEISTIKESGFLSMKYDEYKKTDEYKDYVSMIQQDKPDMSLYLIDLCIYGMFHEEQLAEMDPEERLKHESLMDKKYESKPVVKQEVEPEYNGITTYKNEEEYLLANPNVKPIPMIGQPLKIENEIIDETDFHRIS